MTQVVSLSVFRFDRALTRAWALAQMGAARLTLPRTPGIGFWKLCGSGTGEGFTPRPNWSVYAILATWEDERTARQQTAQAPTFARYRAKAAESWSVYLSPTSSRGKWSGRAPFDATPDHAETGPLAALTRATIRPSKALSFWGREPSVSGAIGADPNVAFKIGIGEIPLLHQVTFSIWPDARAMANFARTGPHAEAIRAVRDGGLFSEELYARFRVLGDAGTWAGVSPLERLIP